MNNYCLYSDGSLSGNFEQTVRVEHEGLSHFHTHPQLQLCENFANNEKPFYLCILVNTWFFLAPTGTRTLPRKSPSWQADRKQNARIFQSSLNDDRGLCNRYVCATQPRKHR